MLLKKILDQYQIILNLYIKGDHNALGVIDAYAKRLKLQLAKYIMITDMKVNWVKLLHKVVDNYNNTPNKSINDIKPNEAHLKDNVEAIFGINVFKKKGISTESLIEGFETTLNDNKDNYPKIIMADQDSVFTSDAFEKY